MVWFLSDLIEERLCNEHGRAPSQVSAIRARVQPAIGGAREACS